MDKYRLCLNVQDFRCNIVKSSESMDPYTVYSVYMGGSLQRFFFLKAQGLRGGTVMLVSGEDKIQLQA